MERIFLLLTALALATFPLRAERHKVNLVGDGPENQALHAAVSETDESKKVALLDDFAQKFPKSESMGWVLYQLQGLYMKTNAYDKALEAGEKLVLIDPLDARAAYNNLKAAEAKKDPDGILKWSGATAEIARKLPQSPRPSTIDEDEWKSELDFANQVIAYTEYSVFAFALQDTDPQRVMKFTTVLEERNPKSDYFMQLMPKYAAVARQANAMPQAIVLGERAFARGQFNEDLLLAMADYYSQNKQPEKVLVYSNKIVELMASKAKPEGVSDADWQKKKDTTTGLAYWLAGTTLSGQAKYSAADKSLRAALPLVRSNEQLLAGALFHLGLANYQMGKGKNAAQLAEGLRFLQQCAAIKSPFQAQAAKNVSTIQKETGGASARAK